MVGLAVLGCGGRAQKIIKILLRINPSAKIKGLHDINKNSAQNFKKNLNLDCQIYDSEEELLKNKDIEWVIIGSANISHKDQILKSLKHKKNIFSEKPLCLNLKDCTEIKKEFDKTKSKFLISYPLRYSPHYKKIKEIIDSREIGKIISMEFNEILSFPHGATIMCGWRNSEKLSGGHLLEKCCHDIDLANYFLEDIPKKVASFGGNNFFTKENSHLLSNLKKHLKEIDREKNPFTIKKDIVDNQVLILEYAKGTRATFHTNCSSGIPERRIYICGSKATLRADLIKGIIEVAPTGPINKIKRYLSKKELGGHGDGDKFLVKGLSEAIMGKRIIRKFFDSGIKSAVVAIGADISRKKNSIFDFKKTWKDLGYS